MTLINFVMYFFEGKDELPILWKEMRYILPSRKLFLLTLGKVKAVTVKIFTTIYRRRMELDENPQKSFKGIP